VELGRRIVGLPTVRNFLGKGHSSVDFVDSWLNRALEYCIFASTKKLFVSGRH